MAYPVLISVYTRLRHLQECIESLRANNLAKETDLFVASDASKYPQHKEAVDLVRTYVKSIQGFNSVNILAWEENKGSSESIRIARMRIFEKYDAQIFIEDDNVVSPFFLEFMNESLKKYEDYEPVFAICGYNYEIGNSISSPYDSFFMDVISANGWGTWKEKYRRFYDGYTLPDFNGKSFKTYEKRYPKPANNLRRMARQGVIWGDTKITHYLYEKKMVCLFPCVSLVQNTGWDGSGEHCGKDSAFNRQQVNLTNPIHLFPDKPEIDQAWATVFKKYFSYPFLGKYKTALYDYKVAIGKRLKK